MAIFRVSHLEADEAYDADVAFYIDQIRQYGNLSLSGTTPISDFCPKAEVIRGWSSNLRSYPKPEWLSRADQLKLGIRQAVTCKVN